MSGSASGGPLVTAADIVAAITSLGVAPGDLLLAHSSLSSFGHVQGGATEVAEAFVEAVSPGGTALVPVFYWGSDPFDPGTTPSHTGAVTEAFRNLPGAVRSLHPTHSVAAVGPAAEFLTQGHGETHSFGEGSPLWKLWEADAWVLLAGCDHRSSSMVHVAEEIAGVPHLTRPVRIKTGDGIEARTIRRPGCSRGFNALDAPMRAAGLIRETTCGSSTLMLLKANDIVEQALRLIASDPSSLLCDVSGCEPCVWKRTVLEG